MTEKDIRKWLQSEQAEDAWYVSVDASKTEGPTRLSKVFSLPQIAGRETVLILHAAQKEAKDPPWVELDLSSQLEENKRIKYKKRKPFRTMLIVQIFILLIIACGVLAVIFRPKQQQPQALDPLERAFDKMEEIRASGQVVTDPEQLLPSLSANASISERSLYVSNMGKDTWSGVRITIIGDEEYSYTHDKEIEPERTLRTSLKMFVHEGEPFNPETEKAKKIKLEVEGYRDWEEYFR